MKTITIALSVILLIACSEKVNVEDNSKEELVHESTIADVADPNEKLMSIDTIYFEQGEYVVFEPTEDGFYSKRYYSTGTLKSVEEQGEFAGCGIQVGEQLSYNIQENLVQKRTFEHFLRGDESGCHKTRTVVSITEYFENGDIKETRQIETCYECDECPCGNRTTYDSTGGIIGTMDYEDCYDFHLNCVLDN